MHPSFIKTLSGKTLIIPTPTQRGHQGLSGTEAKQGAATGLCQEAGSSGKQVEQLEQEMCDLV